MLEARILLLQKDFGSHEHVFSPVRRLIAAGLEQCGVAEADMPEQVAASRHTLPISVASAGFT